MAKSRERKQECQGCGGMFAKSRLHVHKQKEMCKPCIKDDKGKNTRTTPMDVTYQQMLRRHRGLV